jgi:hypothetical protein
VRAWLTRAAGPSRIDAASARGSILRITEEDAMGLKDDLKTKGKALLEKAEQRTKKATAVTEEKTKEAVAAVREKVKELKAGIAKK